ncbi:hypothetical protein LOY34_16995 [Pseudomonas sp. B21-009]|uniref:hypothetical protein n=1 Tax=Pseudomonas sp. B21-009 TaxID=2895470 RepID=UPI002160152F|nr:hypothetical protein [Pseudomonas sp. B21-009]UVM65030.1 hypothetical protein LOY34_16995 [Pseudomonas sp. B21-009]
MDKGENVHAVVFQLSGGKVECPERICDFDVRFGPGDVQSQSFGVDAAGTSLIPTKSSAFAGSVGLVREVFIEIPLTSGVNSQFKFEIDEPAFQRVKRPSFSFVGLEFGASAAALPTDFRTVDSSPSISCREAKAVDGKVHGVAAKSARMCFYQDMFYALFIEASNKSQADTVSKFISSQLGPRDQGGMSRWPADTGKVIDLNTVSGSFWSDMKVRGAGRFMILDESISALVPQPKK